ncbi:MAG: PadR family transcriptional regulator [Phototrophicaceae bacterium]
MNLKGSLPLLILHILSKGTYHGYQINKIIAEASARSLTFKEGTLYPTLHKLEKDGYISAFDGIEAGRKRRYYQITESGIKELSSSYGEWVQFYEAVQTIIERQDFDSMDV